MFDFQKNTNHIEIYLAGLFTSVSRLATEFYANTLDFNETLQYVYVVNTINTEVAKILKNNSNAFEYIQCMNLDLRRLEVEFHDGTQLRTIIRSIILHNDVYMNRLKKTPTVDS